MRELKKFLAAISAVVMSAVSIVSFNTSALTQPVYSTGTLEQVIDSFSDDTVVEMYGENGVFIITPENEQHLFYQRSHGVMVTVKDGTTLPVDEIKEKISPYVPEDALNYSFSYKGGTEYFLGSKKTEVIDIIKSYEQVKSIDENIYVTKSRLFTLEGLIVKSELTDEEIINMFPELCLMSDDYNTVEEGYKYLKVMGASEGNLYNGLKKLQESNIEYSLSFTEATSAEEYQSGNVNIYTAKILDGDANDDGEVDIADATAIIQHIGNPAKYGLTMQGMANADCYNTGDGVTGMDAIAIQKLEAGLIEAFDEA